MAAPPDIAANGSLQHTTNEQTNGLSQPSPAPPAAVLLPLPPRQCIYSTSSCHYRRGSSPRGDLQHWVVPGNHCSLSQIVDQAVVKRLQQFRAGLNEPRPHNLSLFSLSTCRSSCFRVLMVYASGVIYSHCSRSSCSYRRLRNRMLRLKRQQGRLSSLQRSFLTWRQSWSVLSNIHPQGFPLTHLARLTFYLPSTHMHLRTLIHESSTITDAVTATISAFFLLCSRSKIGVVGMPIDLDPW